MRTAAEVRSALDPVLPGIRADLERLVRIPSVSADPSARPHVDASAEEVARQLEDAGLSEVEVLTEWWPAGRGRAQARSAAAPPRCSSTPTTTCSRWETWGCGSPIPSSPSSGTAGCTGAVRPTTRPGSRCTAPRCARSAANRASGVTVLVDGEEEIGSPTLPALLARHGDRLGGDVLVLADSLNWRVGVPALTTTLRGGVSVVVEVRTLRHAVHNGAYGGPVPDALTALARLLATLHDDRGDVAVAGLSRGDADPLDLSEERLRADAGVLDGVQLIGSGTLTSRLWASPALSVVGIDAPAVDGAGMVLVPSARARLALRIGPGDDAPAARDALVAHLQAHAPWGASVTVTAGEPVAPYSAVTSGPAYAAAREAYEDAWGTPPVEIGVGGSIGFLAPFAAAFPQAEILVTGIEDPDTRAHAPNESLHLADFERACLAEALLLERLSQGTQGT